MSVGIHRLQKLSDWKCLPGFSGYRSCLIFKIFPGFLWYKSCMICKCQPGFSGYGSCLIHKCLLAFSGYGSCLIHKCLLAFSDYGSCLFCKCQSGKGNCKICKCPRGFTGYGRCLIFIFLPGLSVPWAGLGICSSVFRAIWSFFVSERGIRTWKRANRSRRSFVLSKWAKSEGSNSI